MKAEITRLFAKSYLKGMDLGTRILYGPFSTESGTGSSDGDAIAKQVTTPIYTLVNVLTSIMLAVGVLMLVKAVLDLINAIQQQDNSGIYHAGRSIAVALLMMACKLIVKLFVPDL